MKIEVAYRLGGTDACLDLVYSEGFPLTCYECGSSWGKGRLFTPNNAVAPAFSFSADPDTGIYSTDAGELKLVSMGRDTAKARVAKSPYLVVVLCDLCQTNTMPKGTYIAWDVTLRPFP